jgi:hypothetical protein
MRIHYRIQHSAGRNFPLQRLLDRLPPAVQVVTDEEAFADPNPLRNYLRCLSDPPADATHLLVIQDDAYPCESFAGRLAEAVSERPDDVLSLFVGGLTSRTKRDFLLALKNRERWSPIYFRDIHHVVALVWPVGLAREFVEWFPTAKVPGGKNPKSDDAAVGFWARTRRPRLQVWAHVPCLVQHPDDLPSVVQGNRRLGDAGRRAVHFEG